VSIKDEAPLIALEERDKIFSKFYRIGNENTRSSKGTGLGLYIVKQIVEQHHAHIYITNDDTQTKNVFVVEFEQYHS
jgi:signal transduction histidine kinase